MSEGEASHDESVAAETMETMAKQRKILDEKLESLEKQIYALETTYLEVRGAFCSCASASTLTLSSLSGDGQCRQCVAWLGWLSVASDARE